MCNMIIWLEFDSHFHWKEERLLLLDSHLEINSRKKSLDKRNTTGNKTQVEGKQDLFLPLSWSINSS